MSNDFFNSSGTPAQGSSIVSPNVRAEFAAIAAGFDKLPTLTGNAYEVTYINASGSAMASVGGDGLLKMSTTGIPSVAAAGTDYTNLAVLSAAAAAVPNNADLLPVVDAGVTKKLSLTNLKAFLKTYFDTIYALASGFQLTGALLFKSGLNNVASAATLNLTAVGSNTAHVTGTTGISAFTMTSGQVIDLVFDGILTLTHHATNNNLEGGLPITTAAGDRARYWYDGTTVWCLKYQKASGAAVVGGSVQIQPISASVGSNALTISASALSLDFRSATLTSGAVTTVSGTPANLVISSGSTLGTVSATQSRLAVIAMNNAGTIELAVGNIAGLADLSETGVISTTAEGGAGAADSASVFYSTTARSNLAYRVIGYVESTQATAGTWATAPSTIQGAGGRAMLPQGITLGTPVASTSGTAIDFTGIPSTAKRITVNFKGVSGNGTSTLIVQLGDSGGVETSGYAAAGLAINAAMAGTGAAVTDGFPIGTNISATSILNGSFILSLENASTNSWSGFGILPITSGGAMYMIWAAGTKSTSAVLDRVRITFSNGTDTFDAGEINISWE